MRINDPAVIAEVEAAFARYETGLITNDLAVLDDSFWMSPTTVRYGAAEILYGIEEIRAFRSARPAVDLVRILSRTLITTYGTDFATASTLFSRSTVPDRLGRQQQSWVRFPEGWKVVAAHVSLIAVPAIASVKPTTGSSAAI